MKLTEFELSYIETALWSSVDDDKNPMDSKYSLEDFSPEALEKIKIDCEKFQEIISEIEIYESDSKLAHDFWLTRNRHGAGFWDGDYPKNLGEKLTEISHEFCEQYLYVGDDRKLYLI
jgi:hypothetical protein